MARCPFATWRPLAAHNTQPRMTRYDLFIPHTMGGNSLQGCDRDFRQEGYTGLEAHFGIGADGTLWQWGDTAYTADAQLDANPRAISVETADAGGGFAAWTGSNVPAWTDAQLAMIIRLGIWVCDTHNIPKVHAPNSNSTSRGIAGHRQGVDSSPPHQPGYRTGGEHWSTSVGKICPGDRRYAQLLQVVIPGIAAGSSKPPPPPPPPPDPLEEAMAFYATRTEFEAALRANTVGFSNDAISTKDVYGLIYETHQAATGLTVDAIATAVVAKLPPSQGGSAPTAAEIATAVRLEFATHLGGTP